MLTPASVKALAQEAGFDLCGIAPASHHAELDVLPDWIDRGYAGEMAYLARTAVGRTDVCAVLPAARSVIALATVYNVDRPYSVEIAGADVARLARYSWGDDYHAVLTRRMDALVERMRAVNGSTFQSKAYVDTGPVQERVYARHAGLGWIGKNTCLINPELGSWLFLSAIITDLALEPDAPGLDRCGTCTLCIEACPTGAIVEPWVLDARRCISYLTIEVRGSLPMEHREAIGAHAFGCDICQDVCPWNAPAATSADGHWQPRPELDAPRLIDLWARPDVDLSRIIRGSAMKRAGVRRLRRNLATSLGNNATDEARRALDESPSPTEAPSTADALVSEHVAWAMARLES